MPTYQIKDFTPKLGSKVLLAPNCDVIGRVEIGNNVSVWFQTVIRGDVAPISIGDNTNVQDLSMLHVSVDVPLTIGKNVSIGHKAILHACTVKDHCLIGMGATLLDNVVVGEGSVVAAGSVLPPGKIYPENSLIMGSPAKVIRELTLDEQKMYHNHFHHYLEVKDEYLSSLKKMK